MILKNEISHAEKCQQFHDLHNSGETFALTNPWDIGSAKVLTAKGAKAIATTSAGHAFCIGKPDGIGAVSRDEALRHAREIVQAVDIPVSADLENGYGAAPEEVAKTVREAISVGLAGCSIEDSTMMTEQASYDFDHACQRMKAACDVVHQSDLAFMLCGRADGVMLGSYDLDEAIRRIKAFEAIGVDMVYVPLLPDEAAIKAVVDAVNIPVNVLSVGPLINLTLADYQRLGVSRISLGSGLARLAHQTLLDAADQILTGGDFSGLKNAASGDLVDNLLVNGQNSSEMSG